MPSKNGVQQLLDRAAIHDLHMRYFSGADRADRELVRECFTDDVIAQYEGRPVAQGCDALMEQIALFKNLENGSCRISTHFAGNILFKDLGEDSAETELNVFAFLIPAAGKLVSMRSLRYLDQLRRVGEHWKISARLHTLDWSCDVPTTFARSFTEKLHSVDAWKKSLPL
jgi:hypothetical protein